MGDEQVDAGEMSIKDMCLMLPIEERMALCEFLQSSIMKEMRKERPTGRPAVLKMMMAEILGLDDIPLKSRKAEYTWARNIIAYQLLKEGMSETEVGDYLGKAHSSIIYMKSRVDDALKYPKQYPDVIYIWKQFQKRIEDEINEGTNQDPVGL